MFPKFVPQLESLSASCDKDVWTTVEFYKIVFYLFNSSTSHLKNWFSYEEFINFSWKILNLLHLHHWGLSSTRKDVCQLTASKRLLSSHKHVMRSFSNPTMNIFFKGTEHCKLTHVHSGCNSRHNSAWAHVYFNLFPEESFSINLQAKDSTLQWGRNQ